MTVGRRAGIIGVVAAMALAALLYYRAESARLGVLRDDVATYVAGTEFSAIRTRCQETPVNLSPGATATGDARDYQIYAYDGEFRAADPASPEFPRGLSEDMRGKITAFGRYASPHGSGVLLGLATPWKMGGCALILLRAPAKAGEARNNLFSAAGLAVLGGLLVGGASLLLPVKKEKADPPPVAKS